MKTIIEMAQDAGFWREHINTWMCRSEDIERFAELVRADERQPLTRATIADARDYLNTNDKAMWVIGWNECAEAHNIGAKP